MLDHFFDSYQKWSLSFKGCISFFMFDPNLKTAMDKALGVTLLFEYMNIDNKSFFKYVDNSLIFAYISA